MVKGQTFKLSTDKAYLEKGNASTIYVDYENISKVLKVGNRVFVDDGLISLVVTAVSESLLLFIYLFIFLGEIQRRD